MSSEQRESQVRRTRRPRNGKPNTEGQTATSSGNLTATTVADIVDTGIDAAVDVASEGSGLGDLVEGLVSGIGDLLS